MTEATGLVLSLAETMPIGEDGDAYLLRLILHDWSDSDSIAILSSIRQAMGNAKTKLLIVEVCIHSCSSCDCACSLYVYGPERLQQRCASAAHTMP